MGKVQKLTELCDQLAGELKDHILPYWMNRTPDYQYGGFFGALDNENNVRASEKSGILNARILWTFSASARLLHDEEAHKMAERAYEFIRVKFLDPEYHGMYWSLNPDGTVADDRKHVYTQSFAVYALSEYYRTTSRPEALELACSIFEQIDRHAHTDDGTGYHEVFARDWTPLADARLGENDMEADRTFNTHLHLLEAYTNLYRVWPDDKLADRLHELVLIHFDRMYDPEQQHIPAYFDRNLKPLSPLYSYGHDIEAAWLLYDAVSEINKHGLMEKCRIIMDRLAEQTLKEGVDPVNGGIFNTGRLGQPEDDNKQWWVQAEALSGFLYTYLLNGDVQYIDASVSLWKFIREHVIDHENGEWFFLLDKTGKPFREEFKVSPWKCPYHTTRTCLLFAAVAMEKQVATPFSILNRQTGNIPQTS